MKLLEAIFFVALSHPAHLFTLLCVVFSFIFILHGIYFYFRLQKDFEKAVLGISYVDSGLFYAFFIMQTGYCVSALFPSYLKFMPEVDSGKFKSRMMGPIKWHLVFHFFVSSIACISLVLSVILSYVGGT